MQKSDYAYWSLKIIITVIFAVGLSAYILSFYGTISHRNEFFNSISMDHIIKDFTGQKIPYWSCFPIYGWMFYNIFGWIVSFNAAIDEIR